MPDHFSYQPDKRHKWLQRLCIKVLRKLKCQYYEDHITYKTLTVDSEKFMDKLFEQRECLLEWDRLPQTLFIGNSTYYELMNVVKKDQSLHAEFTFAAAYHVGGKTIRPQIMGLEVRVVPWMQGMLAVPFRVTSRDR